MRNAFLPVAAAFSIFLSGPSPLMAQTSVPLQYDSKLMRLAEILGSLHYLRNLCGDANPQWRDRMNALISAEQPSAIRKAHMLAAFNDAWRTFSERYNECTPAAAEAIRRYSQEGVALSQELVNRYGN